ncbi:properdin-like [Rhinophrynus dorsalis]
MMSFSLVLLVSAVSLLTFQVSESDAVQCYSDFDEVTGGCTEYLGDDVTEEDCCLNIKYSFKQDAQSPCEACRPAEWSPWSPWGPCSVSCEEGVQRRRRYCTGQGDCDGDDVEVRSCSLQDCCPVNGDWSQWSTWSKCSVTCEFGIAQRFRECNDPEPTCGGRCVGNPTETTRCNTGQVCPTDRIQVPSRDQNGPRTLRNGKWCKVKPVLRLCKVRREADCHFSGVLCSLDYTAPNRSLDYTAPNTSLDYIAPNRSLDLHCTK